jgi:transcriptional antiterminator RfaH
VSDQEAAVGCGARACPVDFAGLAAGERRYVVHAVPHAEERAQARPAAQGFRSLLPRYLKTVRHARKLRSVRAPFFPRGGVTSLVMGDTRPLPASPGVVGGWPAPVASAGQPLRLRCPLADLLKFDARRGNIFDPPCVAGVRSKSDS